MYITNNPELAKSAVAAGVDRIFIDLEILGKVERQGHLSTVISKHTIDDVKAIRQKLPNAELLVRINPYHEKSEEEIESILKYRPKFIMLPMYRTAEEVRKVAHTINGQAGLIPLLETPEALQNIEEVASIDDVTEMYMGLNDLHLALKKKFMFEFIADKTVEKFATVVKPKGKKFGFGGVARISEGLLPSERILEEHERLGSSSVILSRTFHGEARNLDERSSSMDLKEEIQKIRACERAVSQRSDAQRSADYATICELINEIAARQ